MNHKPVWERRGERISPAPPPEESRLLNRVLSDLPRNVAQSFTDEQLNHLSLALKARSTKAAIDYRVSIPFFGKRFFVAFICGKERRTLARLNDEGQVSVSRISFVYTLAMWFLLTSIIIVAFVVLYILKSALGIDLFEGPSFMHNLAYFQNFSVDLGIRK